MNNEKVLKDIIEGKGVVEVAFPKPVEEAEGKKQKNSDLYSTLLDYIKSFDAYKGINSIQDVSSKDAVVFTKMYHEVR